MQPRKQVVRGGRRRRQRGNALVEASLALLPFMFLMFGTLDFGWAIYAYNFCAYGAQSGARFASVNGALSVSPATADTVSTYVKSQAAALDLSQMTVSTTWDPDNNPGSTVNVQVSYNVKPLSGVAIKQGFTVSSTAQFVINH
jgi:Flp pilus assembly protein TadG